MLATRPASRLRVCTVIATLGLCSLRLGAEEAPAAAAGLPRIDFLYGDRELFPSAVLCFTDDAPYAPIDPQQLGDPNGVISVELVSPGDESVVKVTLTATPFFEESTVTVLLPKKDTIYHVAPTIRYRTDKLAAQRQPIANLVVQAVIEYLDDAHAKSAPQELTTKVVVHGINDAIHRYRRRPDPNRVPAVTYKDSPLIPQGKYMIAAYVNENHPWIDQRITRYALDHKFVADFVAYQRDAQSVRKEVAAIYNTLAALGFKYVNFPQPTAAAMGLEDRLRIQAIRTVGDSLDSAQANAIETVTLLASVFQKMAIDTAILFVPPKNSLLAVYCKADRKARLVIDPRKLGYEDFDAAVKSGEQQFAAAEKELVFDPEKTTEQAAAEEKGYYAIDVRIARDNGILPVPDIHH